MGALPGSLDAAVVEATYATLGDALDDRLRMRLGPLAPLAAPLLSIQLRLRLGISAQELRPVDAIAGIGCPVLVVAGDRDRHAPPSESRRLFAAASEPRELWVVSGAGHEDFLAKDERGYRARVLPFLQKHLAVERTSSRALLRGGPGCLIPLRSRA
ncbi:MAG: alpha/beta hydrolase [Acidobacteriota bacterium]